MNKSFETLIAFVIMTIAVLITIPITSWLGMNNNDHYVARTFSIWVFLVVLIGVGHYSKVDGIINRLLRGGGQL